MQIGDKVERHRDQIGQVKANSLRRLAAQEPTVP
jgi:hypothetical protein